MAIFRNQATLSYNNTTVNSNIVTGEIVDVLSLTKNSVISTYAEGDTVTYILNITNAGNTAYTGLTLTDDLGAYDFGTAQLVPLTFVEGSVQYYSNGILQPTPETAGGPPLVISGISVPAGGNVTLVYAVRVNEYAPLEQGSTIVNNATLTGEGLCSPATAEETVTVTAAPLLSIEKTAEPLSVTCNGSLTYTFIIRNFGNTEAEAEANVTVTDIFDPSLDISAVTLGGTVLPAGQYTYDQASGAFSTSPTVITVPAATYTQDPETGAYTVIPGTTVLTVTGTIA